MVNGEKYTWQGEIEKDEFTIGEKVGEVEKKVEKEVMPKTNFSSNILEVGEEIYIAAESKKVMMIKREDESYYKFTAESYFKGDG
ncbi:hypothetical protein H0266_08230 [Halobacillus locisalis]|uniref:Uncharacterized protein n=1 Tax=Halobacillus locisalis TaxID=220753 RepID=A0A838CS23_9BACI|nr:hypothetical protein [Halobacillus locisalis]MBA2174877.1 hypothetical protein [Halobacillus locisalis]